MSLGVDIWWTRGSETSSTSDAAIHCRAGSVVDGIPASWRNGERRAFLDNVLAKYPTMKTGARGIAGNQFSLSDSGAHLAVGVGREIAVGIDIERQRPVDDPLQTLQRLGLGNLAARIGELAPVARNRAFLSLWTSFEAFLKLERLKWEIGAERFATVASHWLVTSAGDVEFRGSQRTGLYFWHHQVPGELIIAAATPRLVPIAIKRVNVALRARIATL